MSSLVLFVLCVCSALHRPVLQWVWQLCCHKPIVVQTTELRSLQKTWQIIKWSESNSLQAQLLLTVEWWDVCVYVPANTTVHDESFLKGLLEQCERWMSNPWLMKSNRVTGFEVTGSTSTLQFWMLTAKQSFYIKLKMKYISSACK